MLAAAAFFALKSGMVKMEFVGSSFRLTDGRTKRMGQRTAAASFVRSALSNAAKQRRQQPTLYFRQKIALFINDWGAMCALPASNASQPKTRNGRRSRSSMGEIGVFKWAERRRGSCRFFVPFSLDWKRGNVQSRGKRATERI